MSERPSTMTLEEALAVLAWVHHLDHPAFTKEVRTAYVRASEVVQQNAEAAIYRENSPEWISLGMAMREAQADKEKKK